MIRDVNQDWLCQILQAAETFSLHIPPLKGNFFFRTEPAFPTYGINSDIEFPHSFIDGNHTGHYQRNQDEDSENG